MEHFPHLQLELVTVDQLPAGLLDKIFLHVAGKSWQCMRCEKTGKLHVFSAGHQWGRVHTAKFWQPGFNIGGVQLLCQDCWIQWLIWQARMGFDLHDHAVVAVCNSTCFSAHGGRKAQFNALQGAAVDSKVGFLMGKAIDGLPRKNGLTGLTCNRVAYFLGGRFRRQGYYESVRSPADLARNLERIAHLRSLGIPLYMLDHHMIIVKIFKSAYTAPRGVLQLPALRGACASDLVRRLR